METFLLFWFPEHALKFSKHTFDSPCIYIYIYTLLTNYIQCYSFHLYHFYTSAYIANITYLSFGRNGYAKKDYTSSLQKRLTLPHVASTTARKRLRQTVT
jgi:hypothetical protein